MPATRRNTRISSSESPSKLRAVTPEELEQWSDGDSDGTLQEFDLYDLDEARPYTFRKGDEVWIKTSEGNWRSGKGEGLFYPVLFSNGKVRKYFAPLNGEIKPDTAEVRQLLKSGGWLLDN